MMKKHSLILLTLSLVLVSAAAFGQLSKAEKKEWKNKAKEYKSNPALLKQLVEEKQSLEAQVNKMKAEVNNLQAEVSNKDRRISELQDNTTLLRSDLAAANAKLRENEATGKIGIGGDMVDGVVFKVQIGAFRNKDLSKYFEQHENFGGEKTAGGEQRITLGQFRDYWEADVFKKYLREMGVKDAWIVPYKDNQRVPLKDVLEGVITSDKGSE